MELLYFSFHWSLHHSSWWGTCPHGNWWSESFLPTNQKTPTIISWYQRAWSDCNRDPMVDVSFLQSVLRPLQMGSDFQCSASLPEISSLLQITSQLPLWKSARPLYYIISCLWARSNISGTARGAEAQYYSLACNQISNGFARHCWAPNNRMWSANWWTGQTPSCAAPRAPSSDWISNQKHLTAAATLTKTSIPTFFVQSYCVLESVCECM